MTLLLKLLWGRLALTLAGILASGLTVAVMLWWNAGLSGIIDVVSAGGQLTRDRIVTAFIAMCCLGITSYIKGHVAGYACESCSHDLRMGYARYYAALPVVEAEGLSAGEQLSGLQNEISDASAYLNNNFFQIIDDGIKFAATLIWLLFLNPGLTLAANLPALGVLAYVVYSSKIISAATERSQQAKGRMNQHADILLTMFPIIRLYDAAKMTLAGYRREVGEWERQTIRAERIKAQLMSLSGLLSSIPLLLLFLVGGSMAVNGKLTVGTLYIFLNLSGNISGVLMNMPGFIAAFRQFSVNMTRLSSKIMLGKENGHGHTDR